MGVRTMKKLVFNEDYQPSQWDDGDECFPNGLFEFNITKLLAYIKDHLALFPIEHVDLQQLRNGCSSLNESTIETADITVPIILAEISSNRFNVIDGNHRLEKAYRSGVATIPAYRVLWPNNILLF